MDGPERGVIGEIRVDPIDLCANVWIGDEWVKIPLTDDYQELQDKRDLLEELEGLLVNA